MCSSGNRYWHILRVFRFIFFLEMCTALDKIKVLQILNSKQDIIGFEDFWPNGLVLLPGHYGLNEYYIAQNECLMNKSRNFCFFTKDFDLYCALNKMQLLISFFNHKRFAKCSCQMGHDIIIIITFMYLALILDIMTSVMKYQFKKNQ